MSTRSILRAQLCTTKERLIQETWQDAPQRLGWRSTEAEDAWQVVPTDNTHHILSGPTICPCRQPLKTPWDLNLPSQQSFGTCHQPLPPRRLSCPATRPSDSPPLLTWALASSTAAVFLQQEYKDPNLNTQKVPKFDQTERSVRQRNKKLSSFSKKQIEEMNVRSWGRVSRTGSQVCAARDVGRKASRSLKRRLFEEKERDQAHAGWLRRQRQRKCCGEEKASLVRGRQRGPKAVAFRRSG